MAKRKRTKGLKKKQSTKHTRLKLATTKLATNKALCLKSKKKKGIPRIFHGIFI